MIFMMEISHCEAVYLFHHATEVASLFEVYIFWALMPLIDSAVERDRKQGSRDGGGVACRKELLGAGVEPGLLAARAGPLYQVS